MPKVKFTQDLCSGVAGSIHDLQDYEADTLICLGMAELIVESKLNDPVDPKGLLLNLNGTPVVDDFGTLVPEMAEQSVQKSANKGGKNTKKGE